MKTNYGGESSFKIPASALPKHSHGVNKKMSECFENTTGYLINKQFKHKHKIDGLVKWNYTEQRAGGSAHRWIPENIKPTQNFETDNKNVDIKVSYSDLNGSFKFQTNLNGKDNDNKEWGTNDSITFLPSYYSVIKIMKYKSN